MARAAKASSQISHASYIWNLERGTDEHIYRAAVEIADTEKRVLDTVGETEVE